MDRILRKPELIDTVGLSSATLYRRIAEGTFPPPVQLGANSVGWRSSDVEAWLDGLEPVPIGPEPEEDTSAGSVLRLDDIRDRRTSREAQP